MLNDEFRLIADLLGLDRPTAQAARDVAVLGAKIADAARAHDCQASELRRTVERVRDTELRIRRTFICHPQSEWEVVVGHNDHHRAPGMVHLALGESVHLISSRVYLMIPVEVTQLPESPGKPYKGVIMNMDYSSMRYRSGDGVAFDVEQAVIRTDPRRRKPQRPKPI